MKKILINPFEKYTGKQLLLVGLLAVGAGWLIGSRFNARYDGVFDLHFVAGVTLYEPLLDIVISVAATTFVLFLLGRSINPKTRLIDILNTCLVAKIPFYVLAVFNLNNWVFNATTRLMAGVQATVLQTPDFDALLPVLIFGLVSLGGLVLSIVLLFNGYKIASNAKGNKSVWFFVAALLVSEIISKIIISLV